MKRKINTRSISRAGIIAALYTVLVWAFGTLSFGPIQFRPAEALTLLPLIYFEAIPALFIGCILSNLISVMGVMDIVIGSLATLVAAVITYIVGKIIKQNKILKIVVGGLAPIIINAFTIPYLYLLAGVDSIYLLNVSIMLLSQGVVIYAMGTPLYYLIYKLTINC